MPLSAVLADFMVRQLAQAGRGRYASPELRAARPLLDVQRRWSQLPAPGALGGALHAVPRCKQAAGGHMHGGIKA